MGALRQLSLATNNVDHFARNRLSSWFSALHHMGHVPESPNPAASLRESVAQRLSARMVPIGLQVWGEQHATP